MTKNLCTWKTWKDIEEKMIHPSFMCKKIYLCYDWLCEYSQIYTRCMLPLLQTESRVWKKHMWLLFLLLGKKNMIHPTDLMKKEPIYDEKMNTDGIMSKWKKNELEYTWLWQSSYAY